MNFLLNIAIIFILAFAFLIILTIPYRQERTEKKLDIHTKYMEELKRDLLIIENRVKKLEENQNRRG